MKQFGGTILSVMGLAVAAAVLSSVPAQASGPSKFVSNGIQTFGNFVDNSSIPGDSVVMFFNFNQTSNSTYVLNYFIFDTAQPQTVNDSGFGSIPASSVNVSGGALNSGKEVVTLNVNTCDPAEFIAIFPTTGTCGTLDITWTELPASVAGSSAERSDIHTTFPNGEKMVQNGESVTFSALVTGTAFGYSNTGGVAGGGELTQAHNVSITLSAP